MTDIVERGRAAAWECATTNGPLIDELCDEIERLRAALEYVSWSPKSTPEILDIIRAALKGEDVREPINTEDQFVKKI